MVALDSEEAKDENEEEEEDCKQRKEMNARQGKKTELAELKRRVPRHKWAKQQEYEIKQSKETRRKARGAKSQVREEEKGTRAMQQ
jgi:hypothetical protein